MDEQKLPEPKPTKKLHNKHGELRPSTLIFLTVAAIIIPLALTVGLVFLLKALNISTDFLRSNIGESLFAIASEILYLLVIYWCFRAGVVNWQRLGWRKVKLSRAAIYIIAGIGWYFLLTIAFSAVAKALFPSFNYNQQQQLGIQNLHGLGQQVLAFVSLAIVPPVVEETLFRGFLFKGLRQKWPFWLSAVVTSLMFAVAHGQLNVGLDVFALSLVLCYITEKTGSILPGMVIHMLKNTFAFILLFTSLLPMLH